VKNLGEIKVQNDVRANFLGGDGKGRADDVDLTGYLRSLPRQGSESLALLLIDGISNVRVGETLEQ